MILLKRIPCWIGSAGLWIAVAIAFSIGVMWLA